MNSTRMSWPERLERGLMGESLIAQWLIRRGHVVLPAYEVEGGGFKGPRVHSARGAHVSPDLGIVRRDGRFVWIEAKHKTAFSWRRCRPGPRWETGIDLRHWSHYCEVGALTNAAMWLLFLHRESTPDRRDLRAGSPRACPVGLFGISIQDSIERVRLDVHRRAHAPAGMAYWAHADLRLLAPLRDVL